MAGAVSPPAARPVGKWDGQARGQGNLAAPGRTAVARGPTQEQPVAGEWRRQRGDVPPAAAPESKAKGAGEHEGLAGKLTTGSNRWRMAGEGRSTEEAELRVANNGGWLVQGSIRPGDGSNGLGEG